ncbi:MAG TPA: HDOD domain-containing protein [Burkholderiaceae bacterium]|nr:HDOD domain-containing protein [Burkholderiaceae bacterium]
MPDFTPLSTIKRLASGATAAQLPGTLGRFELRKILGKGAQATVWLGFDPRLEREVAIKVMRPFAADGAQMLSEWLQEARSVSRLAHPRIVPVFEADVHEQQPYLVFEYVAGISLAEYLRQRGALPPRDAVILMLDVLGALEAAHAAGVIHRDLKPSNVLVEENRRARVMDFGMAARAHGQVSPGSGAAVSGTPAYLAPEAAQGAAPAPAMDVFAAGLVLAEMLSGKPLVAEQDSMRAIYRIAQEDLALPADLDPQVDDALRAIVLRALARDPARRYTSAQAMRDALQAWAAPRSAAAAEAAAAQNGTLDFLLRRMRHKSDFPTLSDSVVRIQSVASSDTESVSDLTNEILKDVALTNKLLRMVNSVNFAHAGGGTISTVSRAVSLVGFNAVRNMALSLVLLEHMQDKAHVGQLKEEFLRALMAGSVASELAMATREGEEAFIGAMFQNLGRLLTEFYFPEEARQIRGLLASADHKGGEEAAAIQVLGLPLEDLGAGVAKAWSLPDSLQRCMRKPTGPVLAKAAEAGPERLRWTALAANEISDTLLRSDPAAAPARLREVVARYARVLGRNTAEIEQAIAKARSKLVQLAQVMDIRVQPGSAAGRLLQQPDPKAAPGPEDALQTHALRASAPAAGAPASAAAERSKAQITEMLAAGVQDITNAMVEQFKLNDVLRMILETMFRALSFRRIVFCLRDPKTETITGRFGLGEGNQEAVRAIKVPLKAEGDLFAAVCTRGADTLISDATEARMATRLPQWYRQSLNAPAFLLLPLQLKGAPFALIYADQSVPNGIVLDEKELALLRTLRNQAVMAFRQAG